MSTESNIAKEYAIVEVTEEQKALAGNISEETNALVEAEMAGESDALKGETKALIDAIKKRAQSEAQTAGDLTRDAYLNAVRQARENIEQNKLVDPERIAYSIKLIQYEAEKNWESVLKEVATLGDRLADAAKAAWDAFTAPRPSDKL
ncbi:hypothetical protein [Microcoleus sp. FACHB-831]|uniref:hypothetical protein n=1 Tax=Microcoleus sp. FACHB-831 TaxID=2692827 RepID=UPI0018F008B7|nr:hypothetical protein [Microcoleus sp. FACHB-831]